MIPAANPAAPNTPLFNVRYKKFDYDHEVAKMLIMELLNGEFKGAVNLADLDTLDIVEQVVMDIREIQNRTRNSA